MTPMAKPSLFQSFNHAAEGVIHALRTQRNLWIHFALAAAVLVAAVGFGADRVELMALPLAITFVLVAELVNTAIEAAVDVASTSFDPMAKLAKDIRRGRRPHRVPERGRRRVPRSSGAVADRSSRFLDRLSNQPAELTLVALALTVIIVIAAKAYNRAWDAAARRAPLRARSGRLRRVDGRDAGSSTTPRSASSSPPGIHHGVARGADPRRDRCPLRRGGRERSGAVGALTTLPLPGAPG